MKTIIALLMLGCVFSFAQPNSEHSNLSSGKMASYEATGKLMNAVQHGGTAEDVRYLLAQGADANAKDNEGWHVLQLAAKRGDSDIVKLLLENGADVNATNLWGVAALNSAAYRGFIDIVKLLVDKGADVNAKGDNSALASAASAGFTNAVGFLLDKGANINATNWSGDSVLMIAVEEDKTEVVRLLLARGAKVNMEGFMGKNALDVAKEKGNVAIVQMLQRAGTKKSSGTKLNEELEDSLKNMQESSVDLSNSWQRLEQSLGTSSSAPLPATRKLVNAAVASGTNTDSSGYVTNSALLVPFALTNSSGLAITDAILVKLTPNKFIYKTQGGGGMLPLASLPKDLQEKFGYDPEDAAQADAIEMEKKKRQKEVLARQRQQAEQESQWQANSKALHQSVDRTVSSSIRASAEKKWPGDYDMQKYEIDKQTEAYNWVVTASSAVGVPQVVFDQIKKQSADKWAGEYDMQEYEIKKQVEAYTAIH